MAVVDGSGFLGSGLFLQHKGFPHQLVEGWLPTVSRQLNSTLNKHDPLLLEQVALAAIGLTAVGKGQSAPRIDHPMPGNCQLWRRVFEGATDESRPSAKSRKLGNLTVRCHVARGDSFNDVVHSGDMGLQQRAPNAHMEPFDSRSRDDSETGGRMPG